MAVINQINGVATSGTSGVNNIFGSGGGGSADTTDAPASLTLDASSTYGPMRMTIAAPASGNYTQPAYRITVEDSTGSIFIDGDDFTIDHSSASSAVVTWADGGANALGTRTIRVKAQEFGDQYDSTELTVTYTKNDAQFGYYRIYGTDSAGTPAALNIGVRELELYSGSGQTGTKYPTDTITSTNSTTNYGATMGHTFSANYHPYRAFDNALTGTQCWTLGVNNSANSWIQLEFKIGSIKYASTGSLPIIKSYKFRNYGNDGTSNYALYGSSTGAFSGEQKLLFVQNTPTTADTTFTIG